ncbi:hypothetical protein ACYSNM_08305 [Myroides sp. LJL116]
MTALVIIGIVICIIAFGFVGYYLWSFALEKYDYNIFSIGMIIRGLLSFACVFLTLASSDYDDGSSLVFICTALILWLWTFLVTWRRTNIFIAFFSIVYQLIAVFFIKSAINRLLR